MGFREQVEKVVLPYWERMSKAKAYRGPESFTLWGLGGGIQMSDKDGSQVLYLAGSPGAKGESSPGEQGNRKHDCFFSVKVVCAVYFNAKERSFGVVRRLGKKKLLAVEG